MLQFCVSVFVSVCVRELQEEWQQGENPDRGLQNSDEVIQERS